MGRLKLLGAGLLALAAGLLVVGMVAMMHSGGVKSFLLSDDMTDKDLIAARAEEQSLSERIAQMQDVKSRISSQVILIPRFRIHFPSSYTETLFPTFLVLHSRSSGAIWRTSFTAMARSVSTICEKWHKMLQLSSNSLRLLPVRACSFSPNHQM